MHPNVSATMPPKKQKVLLLGNEPEVKREPGLEEEEKEPRSEARGVEGGDVVAAALVASNKALVTNNTLLCAQAFADLERERVAEIENSRLKVEISHLKVKITRLQTELAQVKFRVADRAARVIGKGGNGSGEFNSPRFIAFDDVGNLVVSDCHNHRIQVLRYPDGLHLRTIGSMGEGNGQFMYPRGIAFDRLGHLVVADACNHRVQVLRYNDGALVRSIGSQGDGASQLNLPFCVIFDGDGRMVICDHHNHRVMVCAQ